MVPRLSTSGQCGATKAQEGQVVVATEMLNIKHGAQALDPLSEHGDFAQQWTARRGRGAPAIVGGGDPAGDEEQGLDHGQTAAPSELARRGVARQPGPGYRW